MAEYIADGVFRYASPPKIEAYASVVGQKEGEGPLGKCFDEVVHDDHFEEPTWEKAESRFQLEAAALALKKGSLTKEEVGLICAGDLINQCTGSAYGLKGLGISFLGLYGACSTMAEGLLITSNFIESGAVKRAAAVTSSHFSTAERQFRYPLSYGGQRTPTSQWTCTASGAVILSDKGRAEITGGCIGKIIDMGVTDITNMGAAMAPAAADTIIRYLTATGTSPSDYDRIITGDLGTVGSTLLNELMEKNGTDISAVHSDCGSMIFDNDSQDTHCGGSGCGCSASVLCGYFLPAIERGELNSVLFAATGALMSPMSLQQGESIPAISHLVHIERSKNA